LKHGQNNSGVVFSSFAIELEKPVLKDHIFNVSLMQEYYTKTKAVES